MDILLIKPDRAAFEMGINTPTLKSWRKKGKGPKHVTLGPIGTTIRYKREDLDSWIDAHVVLPVGYIQLKETFDVIKNKPVSFEDTVPKELYMVHIVAIEPKEYIQIRNNSNNITSKTIDKDGKEYDMCMCGLTPDEAFYVQKARIKKKKLHHYSKGESK